MLSDLVLFDFKRTVRNYTFYRSSSSIGWFRTCCVEASVWSFDGSLNKILASGQL